MISVYYPRIVLRELANRGLDTTDLWHRTGIAEADLSRLTYITDQSFHQFFANAVEISGDQSLGLKVGACSLPFSGGDAGIATISAPDLLSCLTAFSNFIRLRASYISVNLSTVVFDDEHYYRVSGHEHMDFGASRSSQLEVLVLTMKNVIELVLGRPLVDARYHFAHPAPAYVNQYDNFLGRPCFFDAGFSGIDIPVLLGSSPSPSYDPTLWNTSVSRCNEAMDELTGPGTPLYSQRVLDFLRCSALPLPGMPETASFLHMSERSLHRRLKGEGQGFRSIRNGVQKRWAKHYLVSSALSVDAIASLLGYEDSANFRRAFRHWMGCTPIEYRRAAGLSGLSKAAG